MRRRRTPVFAFFAACSLFFLVCGKASQTVSPDEQDDGSSDYTTPVVFSAAISDALAANRADHEHADDWVWDASQAVTISLNRTSIDAAGGGEGASVEGSRLTLTSAGTYVVRGTLTDGRIVVAAPDGDIVRIVLDGADLNCSDGPALAVESAKRVILILADGSSNTVTDGTSYADADTSSGLNAAVFSRSDLSIGGGGSLAVTGRFADGIASKDGLVLRNCRLDVTAADDGIRGKDYLVVRGGRIAVTASGDGLKSDDSEDPARGYILIEAGALTVRSGGDALSAATDALIAGGNLTLTSGGGGERTVADGVSAKGVKAKVNAIIDDGAFVISSADDAVHSDGGMTVNGGTFSVTTGDDAFHADTTLTINGGTIDIARCYEGIESQAITVNGGVIHLLAGDDGINAADGTTNAGGTGQPGQPGQGGGMPVGHFTLAINGGTIAVTSGGDGLDINGSVTMTGGTLVVNGPTAQNNGAVDYDTGFKMTGGLLVAAGSSGMAMAPASNSTQCSLLMNVGTTLPAGTLFHVQTADGADVLTFKPSKQYQSVALCSPLLKKGTAYSVFLGGSASGSATDGIYPDGSYTPGGAAYSTFTVSATVTKINSR